MVVPFPHRRRRASRIAAAFALLVVTATLLTGSLAPAAWGGLPPPVPLLALLLGG